MKVKKTKKILPDKFKLKEINDLKMCVFIAKKEFEETMIYDIECLGGRVLSVVPANGISHTSMFEVIKSVSTPCIVVFAVCRNEDVSDVISHISLKYELFMLGSGRAFDIDVDGYLGAKALFL